MKTSTYSIFCLSEVMSPLTHMSGASGNEALVMREPVVSARGIQWVPCLSGNALRHRLIREPGARWLIDKLGLRGKLTLPQLNFLFHGGNLTQGGGRENTKRIADFQRLFPLGRLLGGSLPDQILSGSLLVWRGTLVCEENRMAIQASAPLGWTLEDKRLRPAEAFVSPWQYTRGDAAMSQASFLPSRNGEPHASNLMIFSGQSVTRGSCFTHGFTLQHVSNLELCALLLSLSLWQHNGGTIGGQGSRGHGRLRTMLRVVGGTGEIETDESVAAYEAHCDAAASEMVEWLREAFSCPAKEKAGK